MSFHRAPLSRLSLPVFVAALCLLAAGRSEARQTQMGFDVAVLGLLPLGSYADATGPGLGVLGGLETELRPGVGLTVRSGYIGHMERDDYSRNVVPVLGGLKLTSYSSAVYIAGEAGRAWFRDQYRGDLPLVDDRRNTKTAWGVGIGAAADALDLRVSFHVWDAANMRETMTLGVSLAFLVFGY